jgi:hypothetical protein
MRMLPTLQGAPYHDHPYCERGCAKNASDGALEKHQERTV